MPDERDFGQRVMATAGVKPFKFESWVIGPDGEPFPDPAPGVPLREGYRREARNPEYPDPLTPEGCFALWDSLEARGCRVVVSGSPQGKEEERASAKIVLPPNDPSGLVDCWSLRANRAAALLEAASKVLGVTR